MKLILIFVFILMFPLGVCAGGMPEKVFVSSQNAEKLGFGLRLDKEDGALWIITLNFPLKINGDWSVKRVQTYLLDEKGIELSGTSLDNIEFSDNQSLLFYFRPEMHDMSVVIQYSCPSGGGYGCAEAYTIRSVKDFFQTSEKPQTDPN